MDLLHNKKQGGYKRVAHVEYPYGKPQPPDNWPYHNQPNNGNDRQYGIKSPKFERHLFISRDNILFSIDAQLGMMAKTRRKPDGTEDDTMTNATTTFQQEFFRWIDKHIGVAKSVMSAFVLEQFKDKDAQKAYDEYTEWELEMQEINEDV